MAAKKSSADASAPDTVISSSENSDREADTFEDAPDSTSVARSMSPSSRSLINPRSSSGASDSSQPSTTRDSKIIADSTVGSSHSNSNLDGAAQSLKGTPSPTRSLEEVNLEDGDADDTSIASPPSTVRSKKSSTPSISNPSIPSRTSTGSPHKPSSISGSISTLPWSGQAPPTVTANPTPYAPPPPRKLTSPFSWLSRSASSNLKDAPSPPLASTTPASTQDKRNTASSLATIGSNPELMLSRIDDENESGSSSPLQGSKPARSSLRDRFKLLRMREEAGITSFGDEGSGSPVAGSAIAGLIGRSTGLGMGVGSPTSLAEDKEVNGAAESAQSPTASLPPSSPHAVPVNPNLAPGTAAGVSAGPSTVNNGDLAVDWDLWQSVVYEGPAAVARSSPEEMNRAIAAGIPSAIRGVVWQVLAHSKNEELESVYRDLLVRGTDRDRLKANGTSAFASLGQKTINTEIAHTDTSGQSKERDSILSSASSAHSDHSGPRQATAGPGTSPTTTAKDDPETAAALQASLKAEKQKRKESLLAVQKLEKVIKRDLGARTSYSKYAASSGLQDGLFGVCKAYALFDEGVGYAQGMNFLVMPLLFNMPEEEAFCLLVRLMNQYHLRDMFVQDMPGLHLHLYQFERLLEDLEPALYCHLHRRGVSPQLYATQWFLTLFAYRFPLQLVMRIYDLVLSEGLEGAILKFGIVLMQKNAGTMMAMHDMAALTTFLKERIFDVYIDQAPSANSILESGFFGTSGGSEKEVYRADIMVQDACAVKVTPQTLKSYAAEWNEKTRQEKEREAEIETLKSSNNSLSVKVRSLEERAEKSDTEHVQVASELVRSKVENEELRDVNESLAGQVAELKALVEKQPEEIEARLKEEMERIMKRNLEVQNENRALEEQMTDMEKDLVHAKMQYAEIDSNYETLKQKWNDLRRALGD
ncbi:MAG: hypothetical protein M1825_001632 [Sarcosagium campestre]|nr:MAG: hypothetical protein M1825_001632 [Sarcosagium campestre]